jgi:hypothetical protein
LKLKNTNIIDLLTILARGVRAFLHSPALNLLLAVIFGAVAMALLLPGQVSSDLAGGSAQITNTF